MVVFRFAMPVFVGVNDNFTGTAAFHADLRTDLANSRALRTFFSHGNSPL